MRARAVLVTRADTRTTRPGPASLASMRARRCRPAPRRTRSPVFDRHTRDERHHLFITLTRTGHRGVSIRRCGSTTRTPTSRRGMSRCVRQHRQAGQCDPDADSKPTPAAATTKTTRSRTHLVDHELHVPIGLPLVPDRRGRLGERDVSGSGRTRSESTCREAVNVDHRECDTLRRLCVMTRTVDVRRQRVDEAIPAPRVISGSLQQ
jgi:hypothetical protein